MSQAYQRPRGTQDVLPGDSERVERLRRHFLKVADQYGYRTLETPAFEETPVFVKGVGDATDIVQHERYTFLDGETSLTLRPEGTAAVARAYLQNGMGAWPQPVRLCYWLPMFRRERPQAGRYRQFEQYGVELWGSAEPAADAEVIFLGVRLLASLGQEPDVHLNSIGCDTCRPAYRKALVAYYESHLTELCADCQRRLVQNPLRLLDCKTDEALKHGVPDFGDYWCADCRSHMDRLLELLDAAGLKVTRDPHMVRGLDYYTRTVFEVHDKRLGAQSTLLGGGRYDGLDQRLGGDGVPAVGFAGGVERLLLVLGEAFQAPRAPRVYVAQVGQGKEALLLAEHLRTLGVPAEVDVVGRSLKAQMKDAARRADLVVLAGGREQAEGRALIRDLTSGYETDVPLAELGTWLNEHLNPGGAVDAPAVT